MCRRCCTWSRRKRIDRTLGSGLKILSFSPNFERLVLRCIDSYDSESGRIFQHFSRTTRSTILCTAQISKFQEKVARFFRKNETFIFIFIFIFISAKFDEFYHFSAEFWWISVGISRGIAENYRFSRYFHKIARKIQKNARNFRILWRVSFFCFIVFNPLPSAQAARALERAVRAAAQRGRRATEFYQVSCPSTLDGPFSAVLTPIFATKYSFCSAFRNLQDFTFSHRSKLEILAKFRSILLKFWRNLIKFSKILQAI